MNTQQRSAVSTAFMLVAAILLVMFFVRPFWAWAAWNEKEGTLDLGIVKFTNRPPFPGDARGIGLGLVLPIVLAAAGRVLVLGGRDGGTRP